MHQPAGRRVVQLSVRLILRTIRIGASVGFFRMSTWAARRLRRRSDQATFCCALAREIHPPEHPTFAMGEKTAITVLTGDGTEQMRSVTVFRPKGKKLHFVEPTLVIGRRLEGEIGYLKVAMFPGMLGVDVANDISDKIQRLGQVDQLVVDLRGNTGGGVGALRVMSLLTPNRLPVGFALNRKLAAQQNIEERKPDFHASTTFLLRRRPSGCSRCATRLRC